MHALIKAAGLALALTVVGAPAVAAAEASQPDRREWRQERRDARPENRDSRRDARPERRDNRKEARKDRSEDSREWRRERRSQSKPGG